MGLALEVICGRVTNPGATITALTPDTGDSFSIRSFPEPSGAFLEDVWAQGAAAQVVRVRSPRMHDAIQGLRLATVAGSTRSLLPEAALQRLYPTDALTFESSGGAAEVDTAALLIYYRDLPGVSARLVTWEEVAGRIRNILTAHQDITLGGTAGDYQGSQSITADFDTLKADTDYAILGYDVTTQVLAVGIKSPDFGNLRVGGPGGTEVMDTRDWFVDLSRRLGTPHIPVFNSNNRGSTLVDVASVATAGTVIVILHLAELG